MKRGNGARGIGFLSGAGGSGRTAAGIGTAATLARRGKKVLLFDLCFGGGGPNIGLKDIPTYEEFLKHERRLKDLIIKTDYGFYAFTCHPPDILKPDIEDLERISNGIDELAHEYETIIFDPPSGGHPLSMLAAGLCDWIYLMIKPEAAAVASSYCLLKTLLAEGLGDRVMTVFSLVDSPEHAASLKSKFDILTRQFMNMKLRDGGFTYRRTETEQEDFFIGDNFEDSIAFVKNIDMNGLESFQSETEIETITEPISKSSQVGR